MAVLPRFAPPDAPYLVKNSENLPFPEFLDKYFPVEIPERYVSLPVPNTRDADHSAWYRNGVSVESLRETVVDGFHTLDAIFSNAVKSYPDRNVFAYREYDYSTGISADTLSYISYTEADQLKRDYASGLLYLLHTNPYKDSSKHESHVKIDNHERNYKNYSTDNHSFVLSIFSANRYEWILTDVACSAYSITNTALYDTLGDQASEYILELTDSPVIAASKNHISSLIDLKAKSGKLDQIILIISFDPLFPDDSYLIEKAKSNNIVLVDLNQLYQIGRVFPQKELWSSPDTMYTISFTSGTTGASPKGVMLTQRNAAAGCGMVVLGFDHDIRSTFCFLPLAHIYERQMSLSGFCYGITIGFPKLNGSPLTLVEDLKIFKPEALSNVPRVYSKFESALKSGTIESHSVLRKALFTRVINTKLDLQSKTDGEPGYHKLYDAVFLSKLRTALGLERTKYLVTGSAPINPNTIKFLKAALNVGFGQGYGLTESFAGFCISPLYEAEPGACGCTTLGVEIRVRALPEMGYGLDDEGGPRGELQLRGPQIFKGYFKNEEETRKAIDDEDWFSTGDVAQITEKGQIKIVDRVKNFFKLSQGEYVTPEKIENLYLSANPILSQCYVHGDSTKNFLVGVVGVDVDIASKFLHTKLKVPLSDLKTPDAVIKQLNKVETKKVLLQFLNGNIKAKLQGFEKLHNVHIEVEPLTLDRNVVTPTLKLKRPFAAKYFKEHFDRFYDIEGSLLDKTKL